MNRTQDCKTCGETIEAQDGQSLGSAVRRHYFDRHPEIVNAQHKARRTRKNWTGATR